MREVPIRDFAMAVTMRSPLRIRETTVRPRRRGEWAERVPVHTICLRALPLHGCR
jgi:hypothetical protein